MNPTPSDATTPLLELRKIVQDFVAERRWEVFHTPKNLASCIAIETGELMEHFQWITPEQSLALKGTVDYQSPIAEEMADVLSYLLSLANALDVDLSAALRAKMIKNAIKYPAPTE